MEKNYTISIKLYGKDGRKIEHKEVKLPKEVILPNARYLLDRLVSSIDKILKEHGIEIEE